MKTQGISISLQVSSVNINDSLLYNIIYFFLISYLLD